MRRITLYLCDGSLVWSVHVGDSQGGAASARSAWFLFVAGRFLMPTGSVSGFDFSPVLVFTI